MANLETPKPNLQYISSSKQKKERVRKFGYFQPRHSMYIQFTKSSLNIFFDKIKLILRSQVRNSSIHLTLIYHHQSKRRSECANSVISNRGTACMSHMSTVDSHSDKRLKGHDTTNSRNLTNISFFQMEKIKFYFRSLTKGSVDENVRFLE